MTLFEYSIVRYVPDPVRGEFVNVGIVLTSSEPPYLASRFLPRTQTRRLAAVGGKHDLGFLTSLAQEITHSAQTWQGELDPQPRAWAAESLRRAAQEWGNTIQFSPLHPVRAERPEKLLGRLFADYVAPGAVRPRQFRDRRWVASTITRGVKSLVRERTGIEPTESVFVHRVPVRGWTGTHRFDVAVKNGTYKHLIASASFELPDRNTIESEVRLTAWKVYDILRFIPEVRVTVAAVGDRVGAASFRSADNVWRSVGAEVVPESDLPALIEDVSGEVLAIGH